MMFGVRMSCVKVGKRTERCVVKKKKRTRSPDDENVEMETCL